jgi:hypothetical protein
VAPAGDEQADLAAVGATERSAAEVFRDRSFVIYRLR